MGAGKFGRAYRFWGKSVGGSFALLMPWGMLLRFPLGMPLRLHTMPYVRFYNLWCTTAMIAFIGKFGRITAWGYSSYSYWFRNYGCTGGFCGGSSGFMELYWFGFRNLIYLG